MIQRLSAIALLVIGLSELALAQTGKAPSPPPSGSAVAQSAETAQASDLPVLSQNLQNLLQAVSWGAAAVAALAVAVTAGYGIKKGREELAANRRESEANRNQRALELKWRRAQAAKTLIDEMMRDVGAHRAMLMIDYPQGRKFKVPDEGTREPITKAEVLSALRLRPKESDPAVAPRPRFIRDAFDDLFYRMAILEHFISRDLIAFDDVEYPIDYYIKQMVEKDLQAEVQAYITYYTFHLTKKFLTEHFGWWRECGIGVSTTAARVVDASGHAETPTQGTEVKADIHGGG